MGLTILQPQHPTPCTLHFLRYHSVIAANDLGNTGSRVLRGSGMLQRFQSSQTDPGLMMMLFLPIISFRGKYIRRRGDVDSLKDLLLELSGVREKQYIVLSILHPHLGQAWGRWALFKGLAWPECPVLASKCKP